jgi:acyl carrier protein
MVFEKIRGLIAEQMGIDEEKITPETMFADDLGADSLDVFQLASDLEDAFDTEIPEKSLYKIRSVGDAVETIKKLIAK